MLVHDAATAPVAEQVFASSVDHLASYEPWRRVESAGGRELSDSHEQDHEAPRVSALTADTNKSAAFVQLHRRDRTTAVSGQCALHPQRIQA
jgi:hypothetical protein